MSLPNPVYNWVATPSTVVTQQGSIEATNKLFWRTFYTSLDALLGVSVDFSCNAVTAGTKGDGVNRLVVDADIVGNTPGNAHSWIVWLLHNGLGSLCFDYDSTLGVSNVSIFHSDTGFTGGTTTARPTASDEREITDNPSGLFDINGTWTYHVIRADDGIRMIAYLSTTAAGPTVRFALERALNAPAAWTAPIIARWARPASSGAAGGRTHWNSTGWATRISGTNRTVILESPVPFAGTNIDGSRPLAPVALTHASLGPLGCIADWLIVDDAVADFTSYSGETATLVWMTFDEIVEPWGAASLGGSATIGVLQSGFVGNTNTTPPVITPITPVGDLPGTFSQARLASITFDVADVSPGLASVVLMIQLAGGKIEALYVAAKGGFVNGYSGSATPISNGTRFIVNAPVQGWSEPIVITPIPVDKAGNVTP